MEEQVASIYASTPQTSRNSWIRQYGLTDIQRYESEMLDWLRSNHAEILSAIRDTGKFEDDTEQKLITALDEFGNIFQPTQAKATEAA
jgi:F-type H+-transporting ATPase subunit alpha